MQTHRRHGNMLALVSMFALVGCSGEEALAPVSLGTGGSTPVVPTAIPTTPTPAPKRTLIQRNPFGDVAETENLLFDGDFEWSSPFSDEYGWYQGSSPTVTDVVVGADCRSGIKCARLTKKQTIIGIGVASRDADLVLSVWVHFEDPTTSCALAKATVVDAMFGQLPLEPDPDVHLVASDGPDQRGWCQLSGVAAKRHDKAYLSIRNTSNASMLVDDAVMKAAAPKPPSGVAPLPSPPPPSWVPTAEEAKDLDETRATIRALSVLHDGPPTPAKRAFEQIHSRGLP